MSATRRSGASPASKPRAQPEPAPDAGLNLRRGGWLNNPGRGCVASAVLAGVPAKPLVELGFARAEVRAIVPLQIEGFGRSELNQAN